MVPTSLEAQVKFTGAHALCEPSRKGTLDAIGTCGTKPTIDTYQSAAKEITHRQTDRRSPAGAAA